MVVRVNGNRVIICVRYGCLSCGPTLVVGSVKDGADSRVHIVIKKEAHSPRSL